MIQHLLSAMHIDRVCRYQINQTIKGFIWWLNAIIKIESTAEKLHQLTSVSYDLTLTEIEINCKDPYLHCQYMQYKKAF